MGAIYRSDSHDSGKSWCEAYRCGLPNNNSGIDLTKLANGDLVLAYNPVAGNWKPRVPLILSVSHDNGETWPESLTLEDVPAKGGYSYPAIISKGNTVYLTYTWRRERIAHWEIVIEDK